MMFSWLDVADKKCLLLPQKYVDGRTDAALSSNTSLIQHSDLMTKSPN